MDREPAIGRLTFAGEKKPQTEGHGSLLVVVMFAYNMLAHCSKSQPALLRVDSPACLWHKADRERG